MSIKTNWKKIKNQKKIYFNQNQFEFGLKADTIYKEPISTILWVYSNSNSKSDKNTNVIMNHMLILNNCPCGHVCTHVNVLHLQWVTKKQQQFYLRIGITKNN